MGNEKRLNVEGGEVESGKEKSMWMVFKDNLCGTFKMRSGMCHVLEKVKSGNFKSSNRLDGDPSLDPRSRGPTRLINVEEGCDLERLEELLVTALAVLAEA